MPSSISNSNARLPGGPWLRVWALALVLAGLVLGGYEAFWRVRGWSAAPNDDAGLWCLARQRLREDRADQVVFIGNSRIQTGIDVDEFGRLFGGPAPVQLAIDGSNCLPMLYHLARETAFRGIVICDASPANLLGECDPLAGLQRTYIAKYLSRPALQGVEERLEVVVESSCVIRLPAVRPSLGHLFQWVEAGALPMAASSLRSTNRARHLHLSRHDLQKRLHRHAANLSNLDKARAEHRSIEALRTDQLTRNLDAIEKLVDAIQGRGGRVIFVVMPTSGPFRLHENQVFPRNRWWDVWTQRSRAVMIHSDDYTELNGFYPPDGLHLDAEDQTAFTRALAKVVIDKLRPRDSVLVAAPKGE